MSQTLPDVVRPTGELREIVARWRRSGQRVALVPTMGALHAGHLALVRRAAREADRVVVSIFVNPTQFAPGEDPARYPRDEAGDMAKLGRESCHLVWAPAAADMYPDGFATRIVPGGAALGLETDFRPHFFAGVATVCAKLFNSVDADAAIFGEKDYQQLCVLRQLVRDLDFRVRIVAEPTVREADGLALSSRNAYLSAAERGIAPALNRVITGVAEKAAAAVTGKAHGGAPKPRAKPLVADPRQPDAPELDALRSICESARDALITAGFGKVDYVAVREADTLRTISAPTHKPLRVLAAAWLGGTRLIDNVPG